MIVWLNGTHGVGKTTTHPGNRLDGWNWTRQDLRSRLIRRSFMPHALIEVRRQWPASDEIAIIDAVHHALVAAFLIPAGDKHVRLVVHEPHRFAGPPNMAHPEFLTMISIDCFEGRSLAAKRKLYTEIVDRLAALGVPRDHVSITVRESPAENWGIRGGQAACDVELGFDVRV